MATIVKDLRQLQEYASGVMDRSRHHAGNVKSTALTLLAGIICVADHDSIRIRPYAGRPANMLWARVKGRAYAFGYNHRSQKIEIRDRTQNGTVLYSLHDGMPVSDVEKVVGSL